MPLSALIRQTPQVMVDALGLEKPEKIVEGLATRWQQGTLACGWLTGRSRQRKCRSKRFFTRS